MDPKHYKIVADILAQYPQYTFYAFGSRTNGNPKEFSDLDLCCKTTIPRSIVSDIQGLLYESRLPYKVDIVDLTRCSEEFKNLIKNDLVKF